MLRKMTSGFEYKAPQFVNFVDNKIDDSDGADSYFDINHEEKENRGPAQAVVQQQDKQRNFLKAKHRSSGVSTRSLNAEEITGNMKKLVVSKKSKKESSLFEGIVIHVPQGKEHSMVTRQDAEERKLVLRTRSVNRSVISDIRKRKGSPIVNGNITKYVSLAEGILHFEKDTPERFHTKHKSDALKANNIHHMRRSITRGITPNLSRFRHRPVTALTQQQKEDLELKEMRKNQVKAAPLNEKVLQPFELPVREVKPPTKASPFNLTQVTKKAPSIPEDIPFKFTAKPMPKHILKGPIGLGPKPERLLTIPQSPAVTKRSRSVRVPVIEVQDNKSYGVQMKEVNYGGVVLPQPGKAKTTTIKPFSFEERNRELFKKKEQKIQEYLLEEKKAREFHASPMQNFKSHHYKSGSLSIQLTRSEPFNFKTDERVEKRLEKETCKSLQSDDEPRLFRARSPKVLQMKPFEPKKPDREPLQFNEIHLHSERRAKDREAFDVHMTEKENLMMEFKWERDLMKQREEEEEEVAHLRKETVHKALPVPKYVPPQIEKSKAPLTRSRSPVLSYKFGRDHSSTSISIN